MESKDEETVSTAYQSLEMSSSGRWNARNKRLLKKKISLAYLLKVICSSQETCIDWLKNRGLIPKIMFCPNCSRKMRFEVQESSVDNYIWTCKECRVDPPQCSVRHGSWLDKRDAPLADILLYTYLWSNGFTDTQIVKETNMPKDVVTEWGIVYSDICEGVQRKALDEDNDQNFRASSGNKDHPTVAWRKKNKCKDLFLEFLKDADSL